MTTMPTFLLNLILSLHVVEPVFTLAGFFLFVCALFYDAISNSDNTASNDWMVVNNELEGMWKEAVVT
jgi:hypothetical protein